MKLIHLSDLHFHGNSIDNSNVNAMFTHIAEHYPLHKLIITGDVTDDGSEQQYKNAQKSLMPFKGKVYLCPGNHDFGGKGNFYSRSRANRFDEYLSGPLNQQGTFAGNNSIVVDTIREDNEQVMVIAMDSNLESTLPLDTACGRVGRRQRRELKDLLASSSSKEYVKILMLHHHPFMHSNPFMKLVDSRKLMSIIYQQVDCLVFGHRHVPQFWNNDPAMGIPIVLAAGNTPLNPINGTAKEISIDNGVITVQDIPVLP